MTKRLWNAAPLCLLVVTACGSEGDAQAIAERLGTLGSADAPVAALPTCRELGGAATLPDEVRETSGLAQSRLDPQRFWTHNDAGNEAEVFALDAGGRLVQRVRVIGAEAEDWEDIESSDCEAGPCLYVGDIGDNDDQRETITIYRIPEPQVATGESEPAVALHARFPDGRWDAESLFALPSGDLYVVTKGRRGPVALYRYPRPERPGEIVTLERVRELFPEPAENDDRVTAATATPDGQWVGIRSYRSLFLYQSDDLISTGPADPTVADLEPLGHRQGESVAITGEGTIWLSTEAERDEDRPAWARLQCEFPPR